MQDSNEVIKPDASRDVETVDGYTKEEVREIMYNIEDMMTDAAKREAEDEYDDLRDKLWAAEEKYAQFGGVELGEK